jgi:hypothetical protein
LSDLVGQQRESKSSSKPAKLETGELLFDLANMRDDGVRGFRKTWNGLYRRYSDRELLAYRGALRLLWQDAAPVDEAELRDQLASPTLEEVCAGMTGPQERLFKAWLSGPYRAGESLQQMLCEGWLRAEKDGLLVDWTPSRKRIRANPRSLPTVLAWACVHDAEHLGFCFNPGCPHPYFIVSRKDQRYCSPDCARPAKKAAKLKWWHEHRGKGSPPRNSSNPANVKKGR